MHPGVRHVVAAMIFLASCNSHDPLGQIDLAISLPSGFTQSTVVSGVSEPSALAFLPDGTMLVTSRSGKVRVVRNGALLPTAAIDLGGNVCPERERGLLGIAVDPDFASNKHVYLYYTRRKSNCNLHDQSGNGAINRVSRFTYNTGTDRMSGETVLVDHILSYNGWHNGGDLQFGADGFLYVSVGDSGAKLGTTSTGWNNNNSRWKSLLTGKILRVRKQDGAPAPGNPFLNAAGSRRCGDPSQSPEFPLDNNRPCQETFAWGLRNPFRIPFKPGTNTFFINEVGQNIGGDWEEINEGVAGADYGWNRNQGRTSDASTRSPIYAYAIGEEVGGSACRSITGGTFVPSGAWPSAYQDAYLFGDYVCGALFSIKRQGNGSWTRTTLATGVGNSSVVHMAFGPRPGGGQSLYYTHFSGGKVFRIDAPGGGNTNPSAPIAVIAADRTSGSPPLTVAFDGSASRDPDAGDSISRYTWRFGDGTPDQTTTTPRVTHTYAAAGSFTATLTVEDTRTPRKQGTDRLDIVVGAPPTVTITSPRADHLFIVGATITLTANARDAQGNTLPASALHWDVRKIHDDHWHPYLSADGNNVALVPEGPEGLAAASNSYLHITVTATDSRGLVGSAELELMPKTVPITFATTPPGLRVSVEAEALTGPRTITSWQDWDMRVNAAPQVVGGKRYVLESWSDGGAAEHVIRTPATATTYTARFRESGFDLRVNFQLGSAVVPTGYLEDDGAAYGAREGGFSYGWDQDNTAAARERNSAMSPDKRYDTTILMQKTANRRWEVAVPNGSYRVHLVAGDAMHFDSVFNVTAEGQTILSGTPTTSQRWIEATATVTVTDGRLTLDSGPNARNNKLCFVDITPAEAPPPFRAKINFQLGTAPVPDGYAKEDGAAYGPRGNGLTYGFDLDNTVGARDRDNPAAPDQRYDTNVLFQKVGSRRWEIAVPDGTYDVYLVAGDASYSDSVYDFTAEGATILAGTPTDDQRWVETRTAVTVTDGRLTLNNGPTARNNRACFVEIAQR